MSSTSWPSLPYDSWQPTRDTLHRYCQIVGKVRMALAPRQNHWWHVPLYVTPRGLTTGSMPFSGGCASIDFDLVDHRLELERSDGGRLSFPLLDGLSVAAFYHHAIDALEQLGMHPRIKPEPFDLPDSTPFHEDETHASYEPLAIQRFHEALLIAHQCLSRLGKDYVGKASPVHFFWHSFDLAHTRFSGRRAPSTNGADSVTAEAYSHEVVSFGWWSGDPVRPFPAFYAYIAPEPEGITDMELVPSYARWDRGESGSLALLEWEEVRRDPDPDAAVDSFLVEFFDGAARRAGWPLEDLIRSPEIADG